jgi:hypothetical protein
LKTRLIWAVAALVATLGQSAVANEAANKVHADASHAKMLALPSGFKTAQGIAAVDARKGIRLTFDGPSTAVVTSNAVNGKLIVR